MSLTVTKGVPIVVTGTTSANQAICDDVVYVKFVYWFNPTTAGHLLTLKQKGGEVILPLRCESDGVSQTFPLESKFSSIYCDDMDSGQLYIYIR